jgi:FHA domain
MAHLFVRRGPNQGAHPTRNGTSVNGLKLEPFERKRLEYGDIIQICYFELAFEDDLPPAPAEELR